MTDTYAMRAATACMRSEYDGLVAGRPVLELSDCLVMTGPDLTSSPNYEIVAYAGSCVPELMNTPMIITVMYNGQPYSPDLSPAAIGVASWVDVRRFVATRLLGLSAANIELSVTDTDLIPAHMQICDGDDAPQGVSRRTQ